MKARELLGEEAIIGVTVSSVEEAERAISSDANISYLGIGTMFASATYAPILDAVCCCDLTRPAVRRIQRASLAQLALPRYSNTSDTRQSQPWP